MKNKWRRLPATSVINLPRFGAAVCITIGGQTIHSIGWESRFLPTPPAFNAAVGGLSLTSEYCRNIWYGKTTMVWLSDGQKNLKICLLISTEYTNVTDGLTFHDGIGTYAEHRTAKRKWTRSPAVAERPHDASQVRIIEYLAKSLNVIRNDTVA